MKLFRLGLVRLGGDELDDIVMAASLAAPTRTVSLGKPFWRFRYNCMVFAVSASAKLYCSDPDEAYLQCSKLSRRIIPVFSGIDHASAVFSRASTLADIERLHSVFVTEDRSKGLAELEKQIRKLNIAIRLKAAAIAAVLAASIVGPSVFREYVGLMPATVAIVISDDPSGGDSTISFLVNGQGGYQLADIREIIEKGKLERIQVHVRARQKGLIRALNIISELKFYRHIEFHVDDE